MNTVEKISSFEPSAFNEPWYEIVQPDHFWMKKRFDFLLDALKKCGLKNESPLRGLDVGSGNGVPRQQIESATSWTIDCADLDLGALQKLDSKRGRNFLYNINDQNPALTNSYDFVMLLDVVEHIDDPTEFMKSAIAHLKPGGHLIINVPALRLLHSRYDDVVGHLRRYTITDLERELNGLNISRQYAKYWGLLFIPILFLRKILVANVKDNDKVTRMGMKPLNPFINFVFRKAMDFEQLLIPYRPLGTSLIYIGKKQG